jgi:site-specific DNA-methyltransferase (adenine-specific)
MATSPPQGAEPHSDQQCQQGDATAAVAWRAAFGDRRFDVLLTDPPYCILTRRRKGGDEREAKNRKIERGPLRRFDNVRAFREFTVSWMRQAADFSKETAPWIVWTNLLGREPTLSAAASLGWCHCWGEYVWAKQTRTKNSGEELLRVVETAVVVSKHAPAPVTNASASLPWAVVAPYDPENESQAWASHPSHKPFIVLEPLLRTFSQPGALIADPFSGSGAIGAAALALGRNIGSIELEQQWATLSSRRFRQVHQ